MLFVSKNCSLEKVAFMNSSCFIICELNWIVFMAILKHFRVKMRLAFLCCDLKALKGLWTSVTSCDLNALWRRSEVPLMYGTEA